MKFGFILLGMLVFFQGCLKCPDDYVEPQINTKKPILMLGSVNSHDVTISWSYTISNENQFKIERKTVNGDFVLIDSTTTKVTTYTDSLILSHVNYAYRVYAVDGNNKSSPYSNEIQVSTY